MAAIPSSRPVNPESFGSSGLYRYTVGVYPEVVGYIGYHDGDVGQHFGSLCHDCQVYVSYSISFIGEQAYHLAQQTA